MVRFAIFPGPWRGRAAPRTHAPEALEETLARPSRRYLPFALVAVATALAGCDRFPEAVIVPEFDLSYSFESGLDGWTASAADLAHDPALLTVSLTEDRLSAIVLTM